VFTSRVRADLAVVARPRDWLVEDRHDVFPDRDLEGHRSL
jgi:hypothetical protein